MPSFQDSAVIFFIALLLFGPKKLPELARYVGKLMNEFRRASNEFRMQMDDEFRQIEQAENQKKIAAMTAAAPAAPAIQTPAEHEHDYDNPPIPKPYFGSTEAESPAAPEPAAPEPLPIATSGEVAMMPPATGLPVGRSGSLNSLEGLFDSVPQTADPAVDAAVSHVTPQESESAAHG